MSKNYFGNYIYEYDLNRDKDFFKNISYSTDLNTSLENTKYGPRFGNNCIQFDDKLFTFGGTSIKTKDNGQILYKVNNDIYYYDGYIREVLCAEDGGLLPEDGNEILAAEGLQILKAGNLISFSVTNEDGTESSMKIAVRSGGNAYGEE